MKQNEAREPLVSGIKKEKKMRCFLVYMSFLISDRNIKLVVKHRLNTNNDVLPFQVLKVGL